MTEEELTPYVGRRVILHLDVSELPEPQRIESLTGKLTAITPIAVYPPQTVAVLMSDDYGFFTISLSIISKLEVIS
jgi:hypothetical protein